jgi:CheY-like chemotaxis protein
LKVNVSIIERAIMSGKRVLLIEDNVTLAIGLETCLKANGYQVQRVMNGRDAVTACQQNLPDLVVTDVMMQHMDGLTFLQHLRNLSNGDELPVIVISGMADQYSIQEIRSLGVSQILTKPFSLDTFLKAVQAHV